MHATEIQRKTGEIFTGLFRGVAIDRGFLSAQESSKGTVRKVITALARIPNAAAPAKWAMMGSSESVLEKKPVEVVMTVRITASAICFAMKRIAPWRVLSVVTCCPSR